MPSPLLAASIGIAIIGWFATITVIQNTRLAASWKRLLILPAWLPWLTLALGAAIVNGIMPLGSAINVGGAMTVGMVASIAMNWFSTGR